MERRDYLGCVQTMRLEDYQAARLGHVRPERSPRHTGVIDPGTSGEQR